MKKLISIAGAIFLMITASMQAQTVTGTTGKGHRWTLNKNTGQLTVSGTGAMDNFFLKPAAAPWYEHHESIREIVVQKGITSVGNYAFHNCYKVTKVTIPSDLRSIGEYAFSRCSELIPTSIAYVKNVENVADNAFLGCKDNMASIRETVMPTPSPNTASHTASVTELISIPSGRFVISVASDTNLQAVKKNAQNLQAKYACTCEIFETTIKGATWYRISVHSCNDRKEAEKIAALWKPHFKNTPWILERAAAGKKITE